MQMVLAFRGTQLGEIKDIVTNIDVRPLDLPDPSLPEPSLERSRPPSFAVRFCCGAPDANITVHRGFHGSVVTILPRIEELIDLVSGGDASWGVCITGHSLGAALATVCAFKLATRDGGPRYAISHMTFGSPCVGNAAFARSFAQHVPDSWRVHSDTDVIAYLPRGLGYVHVGNAVKLTKSGHLELASGTGIDSGGLSVDPKAANALELAAHGDGRDLELRCAMPFSGDASLNVGLAVQRVEGLKAPCAPSSHTRWRTNLLVLWLSVNGKGNASHAEQTYMQRLVGLVDVVVDSLDVRQALERVSACLLAYGGTA